MSFDQTRQELLSLECNLDMKVHVKLFGTLDKHVPHYDSEKGLIVELEDGASGLDLLRRLGIQKSSVCIITAQGRIMDPQGRLPQDAGVSLFQPVFGG